MIEALGLLYHTKSIGEDELFGCFGDIIDRWGGNFGRLARERYDKPNYSQFGPIYANYLYREWSRWRVRGLPRMRRRLGTSRRS
jgi:hypothetical protein